LISELDDAGLVTIQRRGQGKTNLYTIHFQVKLNGSRPQAPVDNTSRSKQAYFKR
jgi:hypothetical protein